MSRRAEQIGAAIQRAVQESLARGLQDPRVSGLITVTGVRVTEDLKQAVISVSVLPEDKQELTLHGLKSAANFLRREAGEAVETRQLPEFIFKLDRATKRQAAVLRELDKVRAEREARGEPAPEPAGGPDGAQGAAPP